MKPRHPLGPLLFFCFLWQSQTILVPPVQSERERCEEETSHRERKEAQNRKGMRGALQMRPELDPVFRSPDLAVSGLHEQTHEIVDAGDLIQRQGPES